MLNIFHKSNFFERNIYERVTDKKLENIKELTLMKISIKLYKRGEELLIGACDEELLGKRFKEGELRLHVKKSFYDGHRIDEKVLVAYLKEATIANLVGKRTVECAIKHGYVNPECVLVIGGVPHAQIVKML